MANPAAPVKTGTIPFAHEGETFHTYYKVFGDLSTRTTTPLVVLHGGPGLVHDYLAPFSDLTASGGVPVILYDQLGNGLSTHLREKPPTFWTIDLFLDELVNLLRVLGIEDAFDLAGHSWGGVLAAELAVRRKPKGLRHLVLADTLPAFDLWMQSTIQLMQRFPKEVQEGLMVGMKEPKRYHEALLSFHRAYGCTLDPQPREYLYALEQVFGEEGDPTVATAPILNGWTIVDRLGQIDAPTLVINGRKDIAQDFVVAPFLQKVPKVQSTTFENSSHTPFLEERELCMKRVAEFLAL